MTPPSGSTLPPRPALGSVHERLSTGSVWQWLPLPVLAACLAVFWIVDLGTAHEAPRLLLILNLVCATFVSVLIAAVTGRRFLRSGESVHLLLGSGALIWGLCTGVAALWIASSGPNITITVHNLGVWVFSVSQLCAVLATDRGHHLVSPRRWLAAGYVAVLGLAGSIIWAAASGWIPLFFVQGEGGTPLRQGVVVTGTGLILAASLLLWRSHQRTPSSFASWYSPGLALLGLGLLGVMLQSAAGSPLGWVSRAAQYLGGLYLLVGVLAEPDPWSHTPGTPGDSKASDLPTDRQPLPRSLLLRYVAALLATTTAFLIYQVLTQWVGPGLPTYLTFYPGVMLVAILAGFGPGIVATVLAIVLVNYWVLPLRGGAPPPERLGMVLFLGIGIALSLFADLYRRSRHKAMIYDQEQALRELRKDKELLAGILERASMPFAVGYLDGRVGLFNAAFADLTGYTPDELRTLDWSIALTPPEWREHENRQLEELQRTGHPVRYEKEYLTKCGQRVPIELLVHLVRDASGAPDYYFSFLTDITERKQAQALLQRYELLAHHTRDIVLFMEGATGRILEANQAAEKAYGYSREELLQLTIQALRAPCTIPLTREQMVQADSQGILFETIHCRKDGRTFPVEVSSQGMTIDGVRTLLSVIRDISARKHWEESLQESEATFRAILDATQESIWLFDRNGHVLAANETALRRFGLPFEDVVGSHISRLLSPDIAALRMACLAQVVETGLPLRHEDERSGLIFDHAFYPVFDAQGRVHRVATFSRDITETRRAEAALRNANARINLLARSANDLLRTEDPAGELAVLAPRLMEFLDCQVCLAYLSTGERQGLRLDVHAGVPAREAGDLVPLYPEQAETREPWATWMEANAILARQRHVLRVESQVLGILVFGSSTRSAFSGEDLALMRSVADQVSLALQRVRSKEHLQQLNVELEASNLLLEERVGERTLELQTRMHQLQNLAGQLNRAEEEERRRIAQVIHDHLQQLLVAARLAVDTLSIRTRGTPTEKSLKSLLDILSESIHVARSLTAELYPSVLHQEGLEAALKWLAGWYKQQHSLTVAVEVEPGGEPPSTEVRIMLFRAVRELLFNVVKHAGIDSARLHLRSPGPGRVQIEVSDAGAGFDPAILRAGNGARVGLGLFSLQERMELFGGSLEVESRLGQGSRFTITAPTALPSAQRTDTLPALPESGLVSPRKVRILLADDHSVVREGLAQVLSEEPDFEVVGQAANGQVALDEARRLVPDVIVLDVAMPVMNGIDAARRIRAELPQIKILGLSMYDDESHVEIMLQAGAVAFLDKGGPIAAMKAAIRRHAAEG